MVEGVRWMKRPQAASLDFGLLSSGSSHSSPGSDNAECALLTSLPAKQQQQQQLFSASKGRIQGWSEYTGKKIISFSLHSFSKPAHTVLSSS